MRVALLTNIVPPYRVPVYEALAATPEWTLRVLVSADSEFDRSWSVDSRGLDVVRVGSGSIQHRLRTRGPGGFDQLGTLHIPFGLPGALHRFGPDLVISSELGARTLIALLFCKLRRIPLVIWSYHSRVSATAAGPIRRALRRILLSQADAVVGMGRQAREVLESLGVPPDRLFDAPNVCDLDAIEEIRSRLGTESRSQAFGRDLGQKTGQELRRDLGSRERVALVAGRLVPMKGLAELLEAWGRVPASVRREWSLLFVGSGPLLPLIREAAIAGAPGEILHVPAVAPDDLVRIYAASELLVFPSLGDPWGLVVNEAFACARPVLCSRLAGCADDLVRPNENGWLVDPTDSDAFARVIEEALTTSDLERLGAGARATAEQFRPERLAGGLRRAAVHAAASNPERSASARPDRARAVE